MKKLDIIYEDKNIIVVNKQAGILTISDGKTNHTLYHEVREYIKKQNKNNKIFIVHRLDKDTSGVILFAKNIKTKNELQRNWNDIAYREYIAILDGNLKRDKGIIKEYLKEDKTHKVYASKEGELAITNYEVINKVNKYKIVKVIIKTGKKNQIRHAFYSLNCPIVGDKKYGSKNNSLQRLGLHAYKLYIILNNKELEFTSKIPDCFLKYLK